ncbi:MAG: hypothetical protein JW726_04520 [Anaerolineales bacterium]|nr:hypothetical protein [Anaerolineales bacterium]
MKIRPLLPILAIICILSSSFLAFTQVVRSAPTATFTLTTNGDASDLNPGDGSCDSSADAGTQCTLRAAIQEANALPGHDVISYPISIMTVSPASPLPALSDEAGVTIKSGGSVSTIRGLSAGTGANGLDIQSDNNIIQGLTITDFNGYGIRIAQSSNNLIGTDGDGVGDALEKNIIIQNNEAGILLLGGVNYVAGNHIGTNITGASAFANGQGIIIEGAMDCGTVIGTNGDGNGDAAEGNLISGNTYSGIYSHNSCISVAGNTIGLTATGDAALPNYWGVTISEIAQGSLVGTDSDGTSDVLERNVISGNLGPGIYVVDLDGEITIAGNYIGLDPSGVTARPNDEGVFLENAAQVRIGTDGDGVGDAAEKNLISGNYYCGVDISGVDSTDNVVAGNLIGSDATGTAAIPNLAGVCMRAGAHHNRLGSDGDGQHDAAERNLISGNGTGVVINGEDTHHNLVAGNYIGVNAAGTAALANAVSGVSVIGASENTIGGAVGNLISGNGQNGLEIITPTATSNVIMGNLIGLNASGSAAIPNRVGVKIDNAPENTIGTDGDGSDDIAERNIISGNGTHGIHIIGPSATSNVIAGNFIGTSTSGGSAIPNNNGLMVEAPNNLIGTDGNGQGDTAERNTISGNSENGIKIVGEDASDNVVAGNYIGIKADGSAALKNGAGDWGVGIYVSDAPTTLIGTDADGVADSAERNIISGNNTGGISVSGEYSSGSVIAGNYIGTDPSGMAAIPNGIEEWNGDQAVFVWDATVRIGGDGEAAEEVERNIISGNYGHGIRVMGAAYYTTIRGNYIGVDATGSGALGNGRSGVFVDQASDVEIGRVEGGLGNIIAYNGENGVTIGVDPASLDETRNLVRGNAIFNNNELGIDLGDDGVTANDDGDADNGPNGLQNYPALDSAIGKITSTTTTTIEGSLNSSPATTYELDFYASATCDLNGYGEGQVFLGSYSVTTGASGNVGFTAILSAPITQGDWITATATSMGDNNTSEFAQCISSELITSLQLYLPLLTR